MDDATLEAVCAELRQVLTGRRMGRIFPIARRSMAVDFRLAGSEYLFISVEPRSPRVYLIRRKLKDLERASAGFGPFHQLLRNALSGAELVDIEKVSGDRILFFRFSSHDEFGTAKKFSLVAQLTGRSANLFLLDEGSNILGSIAETRGVGQQHGDRYGPPPARPKSPGGAESSVVPAGDASVSAYLDEEYRRREDEERFRAVSSAERNRLAREIEKKQAMVRNLEGDLARHGDADLWRRYGDLLLANLATARRKGDRVVVNDLYDPGLAKLEIPVDENDALTDAAGKYFKRYSKARNAAAEIGRRIEALTGELASLHVELKNAEAAISEHDDAYFQPPAEDGVAAKAKRKKDAREPQGARRFRSSDGFDILVGKKAADNDQLTFRVAGPVDLWLHAADYAGSHVVVRNPDRREIPQRTLLEAAQLAAFYSSGKKQPKAAVNYTQKKFVNKPRGAKPGLVRLSSFKTILVEPQVPAAVGRNT